MPSVELLNLNSSLHYRLLAVPDYMLKNMMPSTTPPLGCNTLYINPKIVLILMA